MINNITQSQPRLVGPYSQLMSNDAMWIAPDNGMTENKGEGFALQQQSHVRVCTMH